MFHVEQVADRLALAARESLGVTLNGAQESQLIRHLEMLGRWNAKLNLVGPGSPGSWYVRHTLDSLAPAQWLPATAGSIVVDVGSGAGFPGIPLSVLRPDLRVILLEPRGSRAAFLQNVVASLGLKNASVMVGRAEDRAVSGELIVGRAVAPPEKWAALAGGLLTPGGRFVLFHQGEPPAVLGDHDRLHWVPYTLPLEPQRAVGLYVPRGT